MEKISVITINFNDKAGLEETILSVLGQEYSNLEFIIIDGGSRDGSVQVIEKYAASISKWVSEPDSGIYDAMNKGLGLATGDWINFKNSGDKFYRADTLRSLDFAKHSSTDVIYGPSYNDYGHVVINSAAVYRLRLDNLYKGRTMPPHQSSLVRRALYVDYQFPAEIKIAGDFDFILGAYLQGRQIVFDEVSASIFKMGGVSSTNDLKMVSEKFRIATAKLGWMKVAPGYAVLFLEVLVKSLLKRNRRLYQFVANRRSASAKRSSQ